MACERDKEMTIGEMTLGDFSKRLGEKVAHVRAYKTADGWTVELGKVSPLLVSGATLLEAFEKALA